MVNIFKKTLEKYKPNAEEKEKIKKQVDLMLSKIRIELEKNKIKAEVMLGGSAAKGTFLKGDFDCDVFVRFDYSYGDDKISNLLKKVLKPLKPILVHGSRDYFQLKKGSISYEIIPVLYVTEPKKAKNVTDMSPLHVFWVKKHLNEKLRDEILLAKLFCKAQKVYGAESYIRGFSGHVLDILIIKYGSFEKLLKNAVKWERLEIIDIEKHGTAKKLNKSKISPLIVIDPIQPDRNAAAALSIEKFDAFKSSAGMFLKNPSIEFFKRKDITLGELGKLAKGNDLFILNIKAKQGKEDIVGCKLLKAYQHIDKHLKLNQFSVINSGWAWNKGENAMFWFIVKKDVLPATMTRIGPPIKAKKGVKEFLKKHKNVEVYSGRYYAEVKRPFRKAKDLIGYLIKKEYVKEKVRSIGI